MAQSKAAPKPKPKRAASPPPKKQAPVDNLQQLQDMDVEVSVELGRTRCTLDQILELDENAMVELEKMSGELVDVRLNGKLFARGEVVTVNENFGVRLVEVLDDGT